MGASGDANRTPKADAIAASAPSRGCADIIETRLIFGGYW
jgi:hypothetical protein